MATPTVLTFDTEGRAVDFEVWVDDLQLFFQCDRADGLSLFDLTSGASPAPPATADSTVRSQWATRDAAARLAVRRHLPTTERVHFSQYRSAQTLYDAVVARYSSPATAALSRLILPYLFPDLAAFPTVADLITHLRTSDTRYRAALPAEDHFLSVCPTTLTVDLLEARLLAAKTSIVAVGASRADLGGFESVGATSAPSGRRRTGRSKGGRGTGGTGGGGGGGGGGSGGGWGGGGRGGGAFLQCDSKDGLSLFDLSSGASTAPTADADSIVRSQWLTRDVAPRLAVRNHLPSTERAHFSQYKIARALYDAVVARYSSPTTAALSRLMLPYLFPDLAAFVIVADLVAHLRTSDARYRAALPTEFLPTNSPPICS
ncbi:unnamed protein product [Closterium sp. NIES-53]